MYSKILHQSNDSIVGTPCPAVVAGCVKTGNLSLASKVLTYPKVRNLSLPPAKILQVLQDLLQVNLLVRSLLPEDLQCRCPLAGKFKVLSEKLGERVQWPGCSKYDFGLKSTLFGSTPSKLMPEVSSNVKGKIYLTDIHSWKKGQSKR